VPDEEKENLGEEAAKETRGEMGSGEEMKEVINCVVSEVLRFDPAHCIHHHEVLTDVWGLVTQKFDQ
jgi:hypothetical protein